MKWSRGNGVQMRERSLALRGINARGQKQTACALHAMKQSTWEGPLCRCTRLESLRLGGSMTLGDDPSWLAGFPHLTNLKLETEVPPRAPAPAFPPRCRASCRVGQRRPRPLCPDAELGDRSEVRQPLVAHCAFLPGSGRQLDPCACSAACSVHWGMPGVEALGASHCIDIGRQRGTLLCSMYVWPQQLYIGIRILAACVATVAGRCFIDRQK